MKIEIKEIRDSLSNRQIALAGSLIASAKKKNRNHPYLTILEGIYYGIQEDNEHALSAFAHATPLFPHDPHLFYNLGCVLRKMRRWRAAEEALQKSLRSAPANPLALYELAKLKTNLGQHRDSIQILFKCIRNAPLFYPAYASLATYLSLDHQDRLVLRLYQTALEAFPNDSFFKQQIQRWNQNANVLV
ncbi:MAG: tetratricopeptide repeat protein [Myxococcaceae bacterium]|nr:tetratricopeptide repeat protein [Myxococcaceae bacterium]MBH2006543.1 tetratricopeptide repeat protein [Myxococcaceae bacterium]